MPYLLFDKNIGAVYLKPSCRPKTPVTMKNTNEKLKIHCRHPLVRLDYSEFYLLF
jgi:hypothetical protein